MCCIFINLFHFVGHRKSCKYYNTLAVNIDQDFIKNSGNFLRDTCNLSARDKGEGGSATVGGTMEDP